MEPRQSESNAHSPEGPMTFRSTLLSPTLHPKDTSRSSRSASSHDSVPVTGSFALGTLRVHSPSSSEDGSSPPPLESVPPPTPEPLPAANKDDNINVVATATAKGKRGSVDTLVSKLTSMRCLPPGNADAVVVTDMPEGYLVGVDDMALTAKEFRGFKNLGEGVHMIWVGAPGEGSMIRSGVIFDGKGMGEVFLLQWDKYEEALGPMASLVESWIQLEGIMDIYPTLIDYPGLLSTKAASSTNEDSTPGRPKLWPRITSHITPDLLSRVTRTSRGPWRLHTLDHVDGALALPSEIALDKDVSRRFSTAEISFTYPQTTPSFSKHSQGADRTEQAIDSSAYMLGKIDPYTPLTEQDLVGELQIAFIAGTMLHNEACLQQWFHHLHLLLRAEALPLVRPSLTTLHFRALAAQLLFADENLDCSDSGFDLHLADVEESADAKAGPSSGQSTSSKAAAAATSLGPGCADAHRLRTALTIFNKRLGETAAPLAELESSSAANREVCKSFASVQMAATKLGWSLAWDAERARQRSGRVLLEDGDEVELEKPADLGNLDEEMGQGEFAPAVVELDEEGRDKGRFKFD